MEDPGWSWPAWKFGLKRDDLFTSLHDKYNTFTFSLQDPEAFHHDVCEIAYDADTTEQFFHLMADRRRQRLRELHESLETLAVEIIANPRLMDSDHWEYALQLFRTKSFDSLVRYFASYLPNGYLSDGDSHTSCSSSSSFSDAPSVSTTASSKASSVADAPAFYESYLDEAVVEEPCHIDSEACEYHGAIGPLSPPESEAMQPDSPASLPTDTESHDDASTRAPSRSMSFSGSESGAFMPGFIRSLRDDETSQALDYSANTSVVDCDESSSIDSNGDKATSVMSLAEDEDDDLSTAQFPEDDFDAFDCLNNDNIDSDTPTPRQEAITSSYIEYKSVLSRRLPSPYHRRTPSPTPRSHRTAGGSPTRDVRRSPEEALSKIQKTCSDPMRKRPRGGI